MTEQRPQADTQERSELLHAIDPLPDGAEHPVLWAMATARAVRHFEPRLVPDDVLEALVFAATRAPSPRNQQPWEFVVVRDDARRRSFGDLIAYRAEAIHALADVETDHDEQVMLRSSARMIASIADAPVLIFVCSKDLSYAPKAGAARMVDSALFSATANLLVAARSFGLGAAFTTLHAHAEEGVRELLKLPENVHLAVTIPLGYPLKESGPVRRNPVSSVLHWDEFEGQR